MLQRKKDWSVLKERDYVMKDGDVVLLDLMYKVEVGGYISLLLIFYIFKFMWKKAIQNTY